MDILPVGNQMCMTFLRFNAFDVLTEHRYVVMSLKSGFMFKKPD